MAKDDHKSTIDTPPNVTEPSGNAGLKVVVGCKLPHGLALDAPVGKVMSGGELIEVDRDLDKRIFLNGMNTVTNTGTGIVDPASGGYGITVLTGEKAEAWRDWYARNRDFPAVKNGLIFEEKTEQAAVSEGRSRASVRTGVERLDPSAPPVPGVKPLSEDK